MNVSWGSSVFWDVTQHIVVITDVSSQSVGPVTQRSLVVTYRRFGITFLSFYLAHHVITDVSGQSIGPVAQRSLVVTYRRFGTKFRSFYLVHHGNYRRFESIYWSVTQRSFVVTDFSGQHLDLFT